MKSLFLSVLFLCLFGASEAQELQYSKFDWPEKVAVPAFDTTEFAVILKDVIAYEFFYNPKKQNNLDLMKTVYRRVQVNTDKGINRFNTLAFGIGESSSIVSLKARTTDQQGKVTQFTKSNLREVDSEDGRYMSFPIDGIKHGDVVEYTYQIKMDPSYWGRTFMQYDVRVDSFIFELICPENLRYEAKLANSSVTVQDSVIGENYHLKVETTAVPKIVEEPYMYTKAQQARIDWKLSYNSAKGGKRLFTWGEAGPLLYRNNYEFSKAELAAVKKYAKSLKVTFGNTEAKIRDIELKVKSGIYIQDGGPIDLTEVIRNKIGSSRGVARLFLALFDELKIEHELVFTSPRNKAHFDRDFDHYDFLDEYLVYFPETKSFFQPDEYNYRYPFFNPLLAATDGLFLSRVKLGEATTGLSKIKYIDALGPEFNTDILKIDVKLLPASDEAVVRIERGMGGLNAANFVPYLGLMKPEKSDEICIDFLKSGIDDAKVKLEPYEKEMTGSGFSSPFWMKGEVRSQSLLESTDAKLIFNIGQVIGTQSQLYQEFDRVHAVENSYCRKYLREITMELPAGFRLLNPEVLNFDVKQHWEDKLVSVFVSSYTISGNQLKISQEEYYTEIFLPKEAFEGFKAVINAAADFNKVKLVFEEQ